MDKTIPKKIGKYNCELLFDNNDDKKSHRYFLSIKLENGNKDSKLIVIMLNPSTTGQKDKKNFDPTVRNVITIAEKLKKSEVIILNLYSNVESKSTKALLNFKDDEHDQKNSQVIDEVLDGCNTEVLVAWGRPKNKEVERKARKIFEKIKDRAYTFCKNTKEYPLHPKNFNKARCINCIGENYSLYPFELL